MVKGDLTRRTGEQEQLKEAKPLSKALVEGSGGWHLSPTRWLALVLVALALVDVTVIVDVPFLRPILSFLYFSTVPGLLILQLFRLTRIGYLKSFVTAVGLSVALLMCGGFLMNAAFLAVGVPHPLSTPLLLLSFSLMVLILAVAACWVMSRDSQHIRIPHARSVVSSGSDVPLLLFPTLFPFLAIIGTYVMNAQQNNAVLIILLVSILLYVVLLLAAAGRRSVGSGVYAVAILMIGAALLLKHGLTTEYLVGTDVHAEQLAYQTVLNNQYWSYAPGQTQIAATLSISLLPAVYQLITGVSGFYTFKLVFQLLCSVTPLAVYLISRKYLSETYAFLAAFLFMAQIGFMVNLQSAVREEIALLFFALAVLVYTEDRIYGSLKALLFIVFTACTILSHYSTALVLIIVLVLAGVIGVLAGGSYRPKQGLNRLRLRGVVVTVAMVAIAAAIYFLWYSQIAPTNNLGSFVHTTVRHFDDIFLLESRGAGILAAVGQGSGGLIDKVRAATYDIIYLISAIGVVSIFYKRHTEKCKDGWPYLALASIVLVLVWLAVPYLSTYGVARLFQILLVFLAVPLVVGVSALLKKARVQRRRYVLVAVACVVLAQYASTSYLFDQSVGIPTSMDLNTAGTQYNTFAIHKGETVAAAWVVNTVPPNKSVGADRPGVNILTDAHFTGVTIDPFSRPDKQANCSYVYLRYVNVLGEARARPYTSSGYLSLARYVPLTDNSSLYSGKNQLYSNGESLIYG